MLKNNSKIIILVLALFVAVSAWYFLANWKEKNPIPGVMTQELDQNQKGIAGINTPDIENWRMFDYPDNNNWNQVYKLPDNWVTVLEQYQKIGEPYPTAIRFYLAANDNQKDSLNRIYLGVPDSGTTPVNEYVVRTNGDFSYAVPKDASIEVKEIFNGVIASTYENYTEKITSPFIPFDKFKEDIGVTFQYPSQYGTLGIPVPFDVDGKKSYTLEALPVVQIFIVEKGFSLSEPASINYINSDYSKCGEFAYTTKTGQIGYKLKSGYDFKTENCSRAQQEFAGGNTLYIFDTKKLPGKIVFLTRDRNEKLLESILDTLEIN